MLHQTFCHLAGIGPTTEQRLWDDGVHTWDDVLDGRARLPARRLESMKRDLEESARCLGARDAGRFATTLAAREHWRLFPEFRDGIAYLDIETTGLSPGWDEITTVALYDGHRIRHYVRGINLDQFERDIGDYRVLVTFNGKTFDVPFIEQNLGIKLDQAHIDLRYVLKGLGYSGGLKSCETQLGLRRDETVGIDGYLAALLWSEYIASRNERALETLLAYNIDDVLMLEQLMVIAYNSKLRDTPFFERLIVADPRQPTNPCRVDRNLLEKVSRRWSSGMAY